MGGEASKMYNDFANDGIAFRGDDTGRDKLTKLYSLNPAATYSALSDLANDENDFSTQLGNLGLTFPDEGDMQSWIDSLTKDQAAALLDTVPDIIKTM